MCRVHRQRGENGIDPFVEQRSDPDDLVGFEVPPPQDRDPGGVEGGQHLIAEGRSMLLDELVCSLRDAVQPFPGRRPG